MGQRKKETKRGTRESERILVLPIYKFMYHVGQVRIYSYKLQINTLVELFTVSSTDILVKA